MVVVELSRAELSRAMAALDQDSWIGGGKLAIHLPSRNHRHGTP